MEIFKNRNLFAYLLLITGIWESASLSFGDGLRTAILEIKQGTNWKDGLIKASLEDDDELSSDEDDIHFKEDKALPGVGELQNNPATRTRPVFDLAQWAIGIGQSTVAGVDYGINGPRPNGWGWGGSQGGWGLGWGWPQGGNGPLVGASIVAGQGGWNVNCGGGSGGNRVAIGLDGCSTGGVSGGGGVGGWTPSYRPPSYNPTQSYNRPWAGKPPGATLGGYNPKTFCFYCLITKKKRSIN